jgi:hypothetical protein
MVMPKTFIIHLMILPQIRPRRNPSVGACLGTPVKQTLKEKWNESWPSVNNAEVKVTQKYAVQLRRDLRMPSTNLYVIHWQITINYLLSRANHIYLSLVNQESAVAYENMANLLVIVCKACRSRSPCYESFMVHARTSNTQECNRH